MIKLGEIAIKDATSIVEARNKVHRLAEDLKFNPIGATKLATITSELGRVIYQKGFPSGIVVGFDKKEGVFALVLVFQSTTKELPPVNVGDFFDGVSTSSTGDGLNVIEAFKYIPDPAFEPTDEFIYAEKERLVRHSQAELLSEVKRKSDDLLKLLDERNRAVEEIKKYRDHLKTLVSERTAQLEEKSWQLEQANLQLKEVDRLKSMFIASMSHELRTPLNAIMGFTGVMLQGLSGELTKAMREELQIVWDSSKYLLNLINDVIDISKIEAGQIEVYFEDVLLADVFKEAVTAVSKDAEEKNIKVTVESPEGLSIKADRRRLLQCVLNLLSNAVKYSVEGAIEVRAQEKAAALEISVSDRGVGIKEEDLPSLFTPFVRLDSPLKETTSGTGLGLYLTKKILRQVFNGDIRAESEYGKGSTFTLAIPLKEAT